MRHFVLLILLFATACTSSREIIVSTPKGEKLHLDPKETLRINLGTEPPTLDWHQADDTTSALVINNVMEGLVGYDLSSPAGGELKLAPALALKWESTEKARIWKFTIRQGVKWSDGVDFTPQHAIDGVKRLLTKETASSYAYFLFNVKNAKLYNEGKVPWEQVGVKLTSPWEITFELEKPMGFFPSLFTHSSTFPIRQDIVTKYGPLWTQPENIVTLGAYNLVVWRHDNILVMKRNDLYYGDKALTKYIAAYMITEGMTALNLFDSGRLDSVHKLPTIEIKRRETTPEYRNAATMLMGYYGFNTHKAPTDNLMVRRALVEAVDKDEVVKILGGGATALPCWITPGLLGYNKNVGIKFDVAKAKADLKSVGYEDPKRMPKLEIHFNTNEDLTKVAVNIQAQLKRNLGVDVELKQVEWKVYLKAVQTDAPTIFRFGWMADYPDPDNFMTILSSYSDNNLVKYKNKEYDEIVERAGSETDDKKREALYIQAQKKICETDTVVMPLYSTRNHLVVSERVEHYPINVVERYEYKGVRLK